MARTRTNPNASIDRHTSGLNRSVLFSTLLGALQTLMMISFAALVSYLIDRLIGTDPSPFNLPLFLALLAATLIIRHLAGYQQTRINLKRSVIVRERLRAHILDLAFKRGIRLNASFKPAEMANLLTSEVEGLKEYLAEYAVQKKLAVITPVLILIACFSVNWLVPTLLILTTPLIPVFMMLIGKKAAEASRKNMKEMNRLGNLLEDRLRNIELLQRQQVVPQETRALHQQSDRFRQSTMGVLKLAFLSGTLLEFFAAISVALVAVYLGLFFLDKYDLGSWGGGLSFAQGAFLLMLAPEYYLPLRRLGALYHAKSNAKAAAEQLDHLETLVAEQNAEPSHQPIASFKTLRLSAVQAGESDSPVHQPFSAELHSGDSLLIEAPSGIGKTTLLDTLAGLRQLHRGEIQLDGTPAELFSNPDWQRQVGYISQHPELIYGSVRENLCLGRTFSDAQLYEALARADLDEVIQALPKGLDHYITDSGAHLSGGQIQRLSIARVFLHQPKLLLLDEPIANLDQDSADRFMSGLKFHVDQGGILIMASHRTSTAFQFSQMLPLTASPRGSA